MEGKQEENHRKWREGGELQVQRGGVTETGENDDNKRGEAEIGDLRSTMETGKLEQKRLEWRTCGAGGKGEAGREICDTLVTAGVTERREERYM